MPITREELKSFHDFASARLNNGGSASLEDCLCQWRMVREEDELVADIQNSLDDIEAGRVRDLEEVIADIREGLQQADAGLLRPLENVDAEIRARFGFPVRR